MVNAYQQRNTFQPKKLAPKLAPEIRTPSKKWISPELRTPDWYIFNELFLVNVPWMQALSVDEIRHFGVPMTGDSDYDRQVKNEVRTLMLPISRMAELFDSGAVIGVINYADTKRIYEYIAAHLEAWKNHLHRSLNQLNAPVKDLLLLDRFAHSVYEFAKWEFLDSEGFIESLIVKMNGQQMSMSLSSLEQRILAPIQPKADETGSDRVRILGPKEKPGNQPPEKETEDERTPKRKSMAEFFMPKHGTAAAALRKVDQSTVPTRNVSPSIAALLGRPPEDNK